MRRFSALCALVALAGSAFAKGERYFLYSADISTPEKAQQLVDSDLDFLDCALKPPTASVLLTEKEIYKAFSSKVKLSFVEEIFPGANSGGEHPEGSSITNTYYSLANMTAYMDSLVAQNPGLMERISMGTTINSRPIYAYRLGRRRPGVSTANRKSVVISGLTHAREWATGSLVMYFARELVNRGARERFFASVQDELDVWLIPCLNPDGYTYTWTNNRLWRKNRRLISGSTYGVDINRNFPQGWGGQGSSGTPSNETYRGPSAGSERETQAYINFFAGLPRPMASIDFHSYSELCMWPWGNTSTLCADNPTFLTMGTEMHNAILNSHGHDYEAGPIYTTIYPAAGGSVDQWYAQRGVKAFTIEVRDTGQYGFELPTDQILACDEENFAAFVEVLKWTVNQP